MIKAILFDLGDVILYSDVKSRDVEMEKQAGISVLLNSDIKPLYLEVSAGKKSVEELFEKILENSESGKDIRKVIEIYKENYKKFSTIDKKMINLIKRLRKNYKVYAFSNTNKIHEQVNKKRGLYEYFDDVFLSCNLGNVKPNKGIFHEVLKILNLEADEVLFIDDREKNVKSAVEIGMKTIQFKDYGTLVKELSNKGIKLE